MVGGWLKVILVLSLSLKLNNSFSPPPPTRPLGAMRGIVWRHIYHVYTWISVLTLHSRSAGGSWYLLWAFLRSTQICLPTIIFQPKILFDKGFFSTKRNFQPKTFFDQVFFLHKSNNQVVDFVSFFGSKIFWGQNNFLGHKHLRLKFFQSKISFGIKFFQTKNYCS